MAAKELYCDQRWRKEANCDSDKSHTNWASTWKKACGKILFTCNSINFIAFSLKYCFNLFFCRFSFQNMLILFFAMFFYFLKHDFLNKMKAAFFFLNWILFRDDASKFSKKSHPSVKIQKHCINSHKSLILH